MPGYSSSGTTSRAARRPTPSGGGMPVPTGGGMPVPTGGTGTPQPTMNPDSKQQKQAKKLLMSGPQLALLQNNLRIASLYVNSRHLEMLSPETGHTAAYASTVKKLDASKRTKDGIAVFRISKLMYNEDENSFEKLASVYSALNSYGGIVAMILQSDGKKTSLYLCTKTVGSSTIASDLLENNLRGQFPGCEITRLTDSQRNMLLDSYGAGIITASKTVRSLSMIPSRREDERHHDKEFSAQGYEKFVDAMKGHRYTLVVISQSISPDAMDECQNGLENLFTCLSPYAKETVTYGENESDSVNYSISSNINTSLSRSISRSFGTSHTNSINQGRSSNRGSTSELFGTHFSSGTGTSFGTGTSTGSSENTSTSTSESDAYGSGDSQSTGTTTGTNRSLTVNRDNKAVQNLLNKIEEHIKRINTSQTFGMWNSACYMIADDVATATIGTSTLAALFSGDSQAIPRAYYNQWDATNPQERANVLEYLQHFYHPHIALTMFQEIVEADGTKKKIPGQTQEVTPAMMISGKEIPTLMGLPRKSGPGIVVDSMAEFGRNIPEQWKNRIKRPIEFGKIYHMGQPEESTTVLNLDTFASHVFICGASGSGKSNTTYNLLEELLKKKVPFLVIEPAKGEYKIEFAGVPGINIFTADESPYRLLQINPFEFSAGIHIREHLDNIIQVVSACWPLYGAMPGLLKQAFEQVYIDHGWDLDHSERLVARGSKFPVFKDLVGVLERIINESPYSAQTKGDYKGALLNRVSSLCNGFEGQIFGRSIGIPDRTLFNENTVIDLSSIGSDETRSLIMGMLIIKLKNYRKVCSAGPNSALAHVTVLEEAHNILKRCSQDTNVESGNVQGAAVGSLCRCIAEMRSAGEGFMIIDQSPGAVDETAIKNTAIKIVMRLPSKNDCEEIGAALSLNENQVRELSRLDIGVAAIFHVGWTDTLLAKMGNIWDHRYRLTTPPVLDYRTLTCVQGAVLQQMYHDLKNGDLANIFGDVQDLIELLCKGKSAIKPALPPSKQRELLDEVQIFIENNDLLVKHGRVKDMTKAFFDFVFDFLRLSSVLRIHALKGIPTGLIMGKLEAKDIRTIRLWESQLRPSVMRYLYMPEKCEPARAYAWPRNASDAEYFWEIYAGVLDRYAVGYKADFRYDTAMRYLNSVDFFKPKHGRK